MPRHHFKIVTPWTNTKVFWIKFRNTFLNIHALWPLVIREKDYNDFVNPNNKKESDLKKLFLKIVRFWPRVYEPINWATGDVGVKGCDPSDFKTIDPHSQILVDQVLARAQSKDDKFLDIGCNCGRFMDAIANKGYKNLYGVDISQKALNYMPEWFPALKDVAKVECDVFQRYLLNRKTQEFDITYSHGATLELVHPSFPLIKEVCRVTKNYVVLVINENQNRYPRFWEYEFMRQGFVPVEILRPVSQSVDQENYEAGHNLSLMVFKRG
jgi:SAM-dependent methyltransferase